VTGPLIVGGPPAPARWVLHPPTDPWGDGYVASLDVELHDRGLDAGAGVELSWPPDGSETDLVLFLQGLADDWRGWAGERRWRSLDGRLEIDARHDGRSRVTLGATLVDGWTARVPVELEPGEQMGRLVADVRALFVLREGPVTRAADRGR
jgi:hypothetical protein